MDLVVRVRSTAFFCVKVLNSHIILLESNFQVGKNIHEMCIIATIMEAKLLPIIDEI